MGLNLKGLMVLSFMATGGITLLVLGCALSAYNWWPIFVVIFYVISPLPIVIAKRMNTDSYMSDPYTGRCIELCAFLTSIIVVSAYALPAIMASSIPNSDPTAANNKLITWGSAGFIFGANTIIFATIFVFVRLALAEDYGGW